MLKAVKTIPCFAALRCICVKTRLWHGLLLVRFS